MDDGHKYFIRLADGPWREVTKTEFIAAEKIAGFNSKFGLDEVATGGFKRLWMEGRVEIVDVEKAWADTQRVLREKEPLW